MLLTFTHTRRFFMLLGYGMFMIFTSDVCMLTASSVLVLLRLKNCTSFKSHFRSVYSVLLWNLYRMPDEYIIVVHAKLVYLHCLWNIRPEH